MFVFFFFLNADSCLLLTVWMCSCVQRVERCNHARIKDKSTHQSVHIKLQLNQYTLWNMKVKCFFACFNIFRLLLKSSSTLKRTGRIFWFFSSSVQQTWKHLISVIIYREVGRPCCPALPPAVHDHSDCISAELTIQSFFFDTLTTCQAYNCYSVKVCKFNLLTEG